MKKTSHLLLAIVPFPLIFSKACGQFERTQKAARLAKSGVRSLRLKNSTGQAILRYLFVSEGKLYYPQSKAEFTELDV